MTESQAEILKRQRDEEEESISLTAALRQQLTDKLSEIANDLGQLTIFSGTAQRQEIATVGTKLVSLIKIFIEYVDTKPDVPQVTATRADIQYLMDRIEEMENPLRRSETERINEALHLLNQQMQFIAKRFEEETGVDLEKELDNQGLPLREDDPGKTAPAIVPDWSTADIETGSHVAIPDYDPEIAGQALGQVLYPSIDHVQNSIDSLKATVVAQTPKFFKDPNGNLRMIQSPLLEDGTNGEKKYKLRT